MKWKNYGRSISIKEGGALLGLIKRRYDEVKACLSHTVEYQLFGEVYRKYRRGKNRCGRCGVRV